MCLLKKENTVCGKPLGYNKEMHFRLGFGADIGYWRVWGRSVSRLMEIQDIVFGPGPSWAEGPNRPRAQLGASCKGA